MSIGNLYFFMNYINYPIGQRIKDARKRLRLSQKEVAKRIGIKQPSLSQIEKGVTEPRESTLIALTRELNDYFGIKDLIQHLPKFYTPPQLAEMVSKLDRGIFHLEWFVYELAELNPNFRNMLDKSEYKEIVRVGSEIKDIFNFDDMGDEYEQSNVEIDDYEDFDEVTKEYVEELESDGERKTA